MFFIFSFCREEGVLSDFEVDYFDNAPCIELLTCQVCCNLSFLSVELVNSQPFHLELALKLIVLPLFISLFFIFSVLEF